jgi:hypothetical protein
MLYYPVKALWTVTVVVIPMAGAGAVSVLLGLWRGRRGSSRHLQTMSRGSAALIVGIVVAGVVGRGAAFPPHLVSIAEGRSGMPNWSLAVLDSLSDTAIPYESREGAIIFGLVPSTSVAGVTGGFVGMVDYMAMESLDHLGLEGTFSAPVKVGLYRRDMTQVCRYLKDFPASLRITGPNPEAGAPWIIDSGCPADIVQPERWISLKIDPVWFERSPWEDGQWSFPTFDEVQSASLHG